MGIIYKLTSPSNKIYIGKTKRTFEKRLSEHISNWKRLSKTKNYKGFSVKLFYAFDKYPIEQWKLEIIQDNIDNDKLDEIEQYYIKEYNSIEFGYNITKGGDGRKVDYLTKEHKQNISKSRKKYFQSENGKEWKSVLQNNFKNNNPSLKRKNEIKEQNSKWYLMINPYGEEFIIKNLLDYCKENNLKNYNMVRGIQTSGGYRCFVLPNYNNLSENEKNELISSIKQKIKYKKIKMWVAISPQGIVYEFNNITKFCSDKNINPQNLGDVALKKLKSIKGWRCFSIVKYI